ncbi:hypothetical protein JCM19239_6915 [Vibrio variabilis]|uniref:Uncharacterized protein n=1 Tax=Vibrio variabilis TaxID=990271 RepID=A0ABQ0JNU1_9VIBR|nr:hypothetical protein JCM19239_6915 [Vibrio variabilis]
MKLENTNQYVGVLVCGYMKSALLQRLGMNRPSFTASAYAF